MSDVNPDFIEKYQNIYEKDPNSKVFAPLAEAYRRMGLHAQAIRVAERGVRVHPDFASGRMALAKIYIDTRNYQKAAEQLKEVTVLAKENLLGHRLYAETLFKLRKAKEALHAYKMVLFLNPRDSKAQKIVKKLESLTADEFDDSLFELDEMNFIDKKLEEPTQTNTMADSFRGVERYVSLIDAFIVRNDTQRARDTIDRALEMYPNHPEIVQRQDMLNTRMADMVADETEEIEPMPTRQELIQNHQLDMLRMALKRFRRPTIKA